VSVSPTQEALLPQGVDAEGATQAPASLQAVAPQVASEVLQVVAQQAPPRHNPELQSPDFAHGEPALRWPTHWPWAVSQVAPGEHSASELHEVSQPPSAQR
jgi:hypothetical protein